MVEEEETDRRKGIGRRDLSSSTSGNRTGEIGNGGCKRQRRPFSNL
jgi:hypothetical protein